MLSLDLNNRLKWLVIVLVTFFSLVALWLRLLPMFNMGTIDILSMVASDDPLYNLRQVEFLLSNNLQYQWFDPMTLYPSGSDIYWGPLFPLIVAFGCIITSATTRPEIIAILLLIPPLMGAAVVAIMYYVGKICGNWKTGLLASAFTAVVTGQFFYRSMYGYADHHIAEVLFSTMFCLIYMYAVLSEKDTQIVFKSFITYKRLFLISALAGIAYLLGLFVMPTMILFAMIVGIFTVIQFVIDSWRKKSSEYLLILNGTVFIIVIIGLLVFGLKSPGINFSAYSIGQIFAYIGLIGGTGFLYILQLHIKNKAWYYNIVAIFIASIIFVVSLYLISPQIFTFLINSSFAFFGQAAVTNTVQEARGWAIDLAWQTFNYGILLMAGGFLVMIYNNIRKERPEQVFAIIWSIIILFSTWQHIRYEYYLAINVALLAAVCVSFILEHSWPDIRRISSAILSNYVTNTAAKTDTEDAPAKRKTQKKTTKSTGNDHHKPYMIIFIFGIIIILSVLFIYTSLSHNYSMASEPPQQINSDWRESTEWLQNNTPDTGVGYYTPYDKNTFRYPEGSYGVLSWWDYGHIITTIGKRIPNANPFQQGVAGNTGSAAYFMSLSEDTANKILDNIGTRYIITDIEMDQGKFWAMATWFNATEAAGPYYDTLFLPGQGNSLTAATLNKQPYYLTMVSRLHNFDGSMSEPNNVYFIAYASPEITGTSLPVIVDGAAMNVSSATKKVEEYNRNAPSGYHAAIYSPNLIAPLETVPALRHYRLVHESPTNVFNSDTADLKYVKIFEYVEGAHVKGEGIIEVPVISNTGRSFVYHQQSVDGEFIVPYSTTGNPYEVKTAGKYKIVGSGREFDVPESAVMQGLAIQ